MSRTPFIAGNWKMHKTVEEAEAFIAAFLPRVYAAEHVDMALCVPYTALGAMVDSTRGSRVGVYAQNMHWAPEGAYTGEISSRMLNELDVHGVVLGHSERRQFFGETDETVNKRSQAVLKAGMVPILCVGETLAEREAGRTLEVVERQVKGGLAGFAAADVARFVLAYEPVWAIGTGRTATSAQAQEVHAAIRSQLTRLYDGGTAGQVRIQYGGSVKADNAAELLGQRDVDGALVGGASLKAGDFAAIVKAGA
jgi:triosephosphate isomerase